MLQKSDSVVATLSFKDVCTSSSTPVVREFSLALPSR
jgi:hypothetical protein